MKEAALMAGELTPPMCNKRAANSSKDLKQTTCGSKELEGPPANQDTSPPAKRKPCPQSSTLDTEHSVEATTAGAKREVSMLLSKFAQVLRERAAADTSQMMELDGILAEAQSLESYLKEKKKCLRQTLALISDKLQG